MTEPTGARVLVARDNPHSGDVICADCDRPSNYRVMVDGQSWATSCRDHLRGQVNSGRALFHLYPLSVTEVFEKLVPTFRNSQLDSTHPVP